MEGNMHKRGFVRVLWGDYSKNEGWINPSNRRSKMDNEILEALDNPYNPFFNVYIYGLDNFLKLQDLGLENKGCKLILLDNKPWLYDPQTQFWKHKLDILDYAMHEDKFDELIYLDWDCIPIKPIYKNLWEILHQKSSIQANLIMYRRKKCSWRNVDWRKTSNGGFLYIGNRQITKELLRVWDEMPENMKFWDEICISKLTDEITNGWKDIDTYWNLFEPEVCNLKKKSASDELALKKDICFMHYVQSRNNLNQRVDRYITGKS
jgi:hypothetical protein